MSIANSIFAGNGFPQSIATHLRVPVKGPFNTLVIVHLLGAGALPGISINSGEMKRSQLSFPSNFILAGFDQRLPPAFVHSTAGFLSYGASSNDATWIYAIDDVSARFDEIGRYWVDYSAAVQNIREVTSAAFSLTSWVLVNEPPLHPSRHPVPTSMMSRVTEVTNRFALPLDLFTSEHAPRSQGECSRERFIDG